MPKFFIYWEVEPAVIPDDPEERLKLWITLTQMVKADMETGVLKDWGIRSGEVSGYGVTSDIGEAEVHSMMMKWMPYIKFAVNPVLTVDQHLGALKKAAEMMKK